MMFHRSRFMFVLIAFLFGSLLKASFVFGDIPQGISFQARVVDGGGNPITGTADLTFTLYADATGNNPTGWTETFASEPVINGVFSVVLGSVAPFPQGLFNTPLWLGIQVNSDPEMTPLQELQSVPYAFQAESVAVGVITTDSLADAIITTDKIVDGSVIASKIDSTGLDSDSVDGIEGAEIITQSAGGTISNADLEVTGTGLIKANGAGLQFADGSIQTSAVPLVTTTKTETVVCGSQTIQSVLDNHVDGGYLDIIVQGNCTEDLAINSVASRVQIRGNCADGADTLTGTGTGSAISIERPTILWLTDLTIDSNGAIGVNATRNAVVSMYTNGCGGDGKVTISNSSYAMNGQYGAQYVLNGVATNNTSINSLFLGDDAYARLIDVKFTESFAYGPPNWPAVVSVGRAAGVRIDGASEIHNNYLSGSEPGVALDVWQQSAIRVNSADINGNVNLSSSSHGSIRNCSLSGNLSVWNSSTGDLRNCAMDELGSFKSRLRIGKGVEFTVRSGSSLLVDGIDVTDGALAIQNGTTVSCTNGAGNCDFWVDGGHLELGADINFNLLELRRESKTRLYANDITVNEFRVGDGSQVRTDTGSLNFDTLNIFGQAIVNFHQNTVLGCTNGPATCRGWINDSTVEIQSHLNMDELSVHRGSLLQITDNGGSGDEFELNRFNITGRSEVVLDFDGHLKANQVYIDENSALNFNQNSAFSCKAGSGTCDIDVNHSSQLRVNADMDLNRLTAYDGSTIMIVDWGGATPTLTANELEIGDRSELEVNNNTNLAVDSLRINNFSSFNLRAGSSFACKGAPGTCSVNLNSAIAQISENIQADVHISTASVVQLDAEITDGEVQVIDNSILNLHSGSRVNGDLDCRDGCTVNASHGEITGRVHASRGSIFHFGDGLSMLGSIELRDSSGIHFDPNITWGSGVTPVWPSGPVLRVAQSSQAYVNDNTVIQGNVNISNGSYLRLGNNSGVTDRLAVQNLSSAQTAVNVDLNELRVTSGSYLQINDTLSIDGGVFVDGNSKVELSGNANVSMSSSAMSLEQGAVLRMSGSSSLGRIDHNAPAVTLGEFSTLTIENDALITGSVQVEDFAKFNLRGTGAVLNGNLNLNGTVAPSVFRNKGTLEIQNGHDVQCASNMAALLGTTPTFSGGGLVGPCNNQSTP